MFGFANEIVEENFDFILCCVMLITIIARIVFSRILFILRPPSKNYCAGVYRVAVGTNYTRGPYPYCHTAFWST